MTGSSLKSIDSVTLGVADPTAAEDFYTTAFGLGTHTIWKVATSAKKDTGPDTQQIDQFVLLLGVADFAASKRFYIDHGFTVSKSFGKYAEFATPSSSVKFVLYGRRGLAKDAGVSPDGIGSHRLTISGDVGPLTDPDGFAWEAASV